MTSATAIHDLREANASNAPIPQLDSKGARERQLIERVLAGEKKFFMN